MKDRQEFEGKLIETRKNSEMIGPAAVLARLQAGRARLLDVRSEGEFEKAAIPDSLNIPILNNEHRHLVGTAYKQEGSERAVRLGYDLVGPLREELVERWTNWFSGVAADERFVTCWRGGQRSRIACEWIEDSGISVRRVEGGFKALRHELLSALEGPPEFLLFGGFTGSGKTALLQKLESDFVLDLEGLANHRGSIFGRFLDRPQPQQGTFENAIGLKLFGRMQPYVVEAESRMIGTCVIPNSVKAAMDKAPMVLVNEPVENRARNIFAEYVAATYRVKPDADQWLRMHQHFETCLEKIQRRLGGALFARIRGELWKAFLREDLEFETHRTWITSLLEDYYDRLYQHSLKAQERQIAFEGNWRECHEFLAASINKWKSEATLK